MRFLSLPSWLQDSQHHHLKASSTPSCCPLIHTHTSHLLGQGWDHIPYSIYSKCLAFSACREEVAVSAKTKKWRVAVCAVPGENADAAECIFLWGSLVLILILCLCPQGLNGHSCIVAKPPLAAPLCATVEKDVNQHRNRSTAQNSLNGSSWCQSLARSGLSDCRGHVEQPGEPSSCLPLSLVSPL